MTTKRSFKSLIDQAKKRDSYWVGKAIHDFTEEVVTLMELRGITKAELARHMGTSPAYVTKVLRGDTNFTIESMVRMVRALDGEFSLHVTRKEDNVRWYAALNPQGHNAPQGDDEYHNIAEHTVMTKSAWKQQVPYEPYPTTA